MSNEKNNQQNNQQNNNSQQQGRERVRLNTNRIERRSYDPSRTEK